MDKRFIVFSHHPEAESRAVNSSLATLFSSPSSTFHKTGFIRVQDALEAQLDELLHNRAAQPDDSFLFNGFGSLLHSGSIEALREAFLRKTPVVIYWHETAWNLRAMLQKAPADLVDELTLLLQALQPENWVASSHSIQLAVMLFGLPYESFVVVNEIVDLKRFTPPPPRKLAESNRPKRVVGAGLWDPRKGKDIFENLALDLVRETETAFHWFTPQPRQAPASLSRVVIWEGFAEDFHDHLKAFDVFLLTSRDDPFPLVALEALASGVPVLVFSWLAIADHLPDDLRCADQEEMREKLLHLLASPPEPQSMREIAEQFGVQDFIARVNAYRREIRVAPPFLEPAKATRGFDSRVNRLAEKQIELNSRELALHPLENNIGLVNGLAQVGRTADRARRGLRRRNQPKGAAYFILRILRRMSLIRPISVCVVGNSPSVIGSSKGAAVDQCDIVVRVNDFVTTGYEVDVGRKTSIVVVSPSVKFSPELSKVSPRRIFVFGANLGDNFSRIILRLKANPNGLPLVPRRRNLLSRLMYRDLLGLTVGLQNPAKQWPTTGMVAIIASLDFLSRLGPIFCHGFSFYEENPIHTERYHGSKAKADGNHDFAAERTFFHQLIKEGQVRVL